MILQSIKIENFKGIASEAVEFSSNETRIVRNNGMGKALSCMHSFGYSMAKMQMAAAYALNQRPMGWKSTT
jgi:hypothetical protein